MQPVIAVIAAGSMGSAVGKRLVDHGAKVVTVLTGRSEETAARARAAGMIATSEAEAAGADFILSIVPPGDALALAESLAPYLKRAGHRPVFVDCNAVNAGTVLRIANALAPTGCAFVDAGIIGSPPKPESPGPAFYASGPDARRFAELGHFGLDVRVIEGPPGAASTLKMSYAGITKGLTALGAAVMLAATREGTAQALHHELARSQPALLAWLTRQVPLMYPKAYRWVAEMEQIADFVSEDSAAQQIFNGAAEFYQQIATDVAADRREVSMLSSFVKQGT